MCRVSRGRLRPVGGCPSESDEDKCGIGGVGWRGRTIVGLRSPVGREPRAGADGSDRAKLLTSSWSSPRRSFAHTPLPSSRSHLPLRTPLLYKLTPAATSKRHTLSLATSRASTASTTSAQCCVSRTAGLCEWISASDDERKPGRCDGRHHVSRWLSPRTRRSVRCTHVPKLGDGWMRGRDRRHHTHAAAHTSSLDITPPNHTELPADAPTIVVCHGLTGNARESYVRNVLNWAIKPKSQGGIGARGVVVNVSSSLFHSLSPSPLQPANASSGDAVAHPSHLLSCTPPPRHAT